MSFEKGKYFVNDALEICFITDLPDTFKVEFFNLNLMKVCIVDVEYFISYNRTMFTYGEILSFAKSHDVKTRPFYEVGNSLMVIGSINRNKSCAFAIRIYKDTSCRLNKQYGKEHGPKYRISKQANEIGISYFKKMIPSELNDTYTIDGLVYKGSEDIKLPYNTLNADFVKGFLTIRGSIPVFLNDHIKDQEDNSDDNDPGCTPSKNTNDPFMKFAIDELDQYLKSTKYHKVFSELKDFYLKNK